MASSILKGNLLLTSAIACTIIRRGRDQNYGCRGREHYALRLEREKLETKIDAKNKVRTNKILELNLNAPMPSTDDNLLIKAKWGKGFITVSRTPMPWSYSGQEPVARLRAYNSDSEDEMRKARKKNRS